MNRGTVVTPVAVSMVTTHPVPDADAVIDGMGHRTHIRTRTAATTTSLPPPQAVAAADPLFAPVSRHHLVLFLRRYRGYEYPHARQCY